jgi:PAS domain S-box-containing protein
MKRFPGVYLFFSLLIAGIVAISLHYAIYQYLLSQSKEEIESILLSHRGFHLYIQRDMHPAFYADVAEGSISQELYDPRILSSSYITRVMHGYFNQERKKKELPEVYYKMAANNPRNPVNKADAAEILLIRKFNANRELKEYEEVLTIEGKKVLCYAIPFLENGKPCMRCHGDPEDAPPGLRAMYPAEGGFHEELGEIRAIESIRIPLATEVFSALKLSISLTAGFLALLLLCLFNGRLRQRVKEQTSQLVSDIAERQKISDKLAVAHQETLAILDSLDALVYVTDMATYELLFVNAYGRKLWGDDIQGKTCWQVLQKGQAGPCLWCTNDRLLGLDGQPTGVYAWEFQNTITAAWFDCRDQAIPWIDGRLVRMEIATDISERKRTEADLRHERLFLQTIFDTLEEAIVACDANGLLSRFNDAARRFHGIPEAPIPPEQWPSHFDLYLADGKTLMQKEDTPLYLALQGERVSNAEMMIIPKQGQARVVDANGQALKDRDGEIIGAVVSMHDITKRRAAEQVLAKAAREWSAAMDASEDIIYLLDLERRVVRANRAFYLLTGSTPESAIGKHIVELVHPHGEKVPCPICLAQEEKQDLTLTMEPDHPDNPAGRPIEINLRIVRDDDGNSISMLITLHDLSHERQVQVELTKYREQLEELVQTRTKELATKNAQLAELNKFFVGRELKMMELKEKIKELENKLHPEIRMQNNEDKK